MKLQVMNFGWLALVGWFCCLYTYILNMICYHILLIILLNKPKLTFGPQLNDFNYFYLTQIILFTINYLFAHRLMVLSISM